MNALQEKFISRTFQRSAPFLENFSELERQELVQATLEHLRTMPPIVFNFFRIGSSILAIFPFMAKAPLIKQMEKMTSKLVKTILLLYIAETLHR